MPRRMVGLTGGIGAGKSTVAALLSARGAVVVDADAIARQVVEPGSPAVGELVDRFGPDILAADGTLDRAALAAKAFVDACAREALEAITHPAIAREFLRRIDAAPADAIVVHDVPLLAESNRGLEYDAVIVVVAPRDLRLARLEARGVDRSDAERRMAMQASDGQRRALATWVVDNRGDLDALADQVAAIWPELERLGAEQPKPRDTPDKP
ncbi:MAG: dephospho-CoA kinase [Actinomycetota bacterium]